MKEFLHLLGGNLALPMILALYFFAIVGVLINLLHHANTRDQNSENTPVKFSRWFLIKDNRRRLYMDVLCLFIIIRFLPFFIDFDTTNQEAWLIGAFFVGFGFDKGFEKLQAIQGSILKVKRDVPDNQRKRLKEMCKILIIEDNPVSMHLYQQTLRNAGHDIIMSANGNEACDMARKYDPDLVFLNAILPGKSSIQVYRELQADNDRHSAIPVIISSESFDQDIIIEKTGIAKDRIILKPINFGELNVLIKTIQECINNFKISGHARKRD